MIDLGISRVSTVFSRSDRYHVVYFDCGCDALHDAADGALDVLARFWCARVHARADVARTFVRWR